MFSLVPAVEICVLPLFCLDLQSGQRFIDFTDLKEPGVGFTGFLYSFSVYYFTDFCFNLCHLLSSATFLFLLLTLGSFALFFFFWFIEVEAEVVDLRPFFSNTVIQCYAFPYNGALATLTTFNKLYFHCHSIQNILSFVISSWTYPLFRSVLFSFRILEIFHILFCYGFCNLTPLWQRTQFV